jgi:two-component system nitrogen regulation sensor histidine kinase NtrY
MTASRRRWLVVAALAVAGPLAVYYLIDDASKSGPPQRVEHLLLPALSLALVAAALGLAGVLIRNLVKLVVERKRGLLGSKLRSKLVFFYLALVFLPAFVLFYGSVEVIKQTVEAIFRTPLQQLTGGQEIRDRWWEEFLDRASRRARSLADEVRAPGAPPAAGATNPLEILLERHRQDEALSAVHVVVAGRPAATAVGPLPAEARGRLVGQLDELARQALARARPESARARVGKELVALAAEPFVLDSGQPGCVAVGVQLPAAIASSLEAATDAVQQYQQFRLQRRDLVRFYVTLIGLIFMATLFVATWLGFYLARRITAPIQELVVAAREISAGNLDVRVHTRIGDEMGLLVDAFNEMAAELEENRAVITRSTADLRRSNQALEERRRYIETLVANLSTAVISVDPSGRVTTANPAVEQVLGVRLAAGADLRRRLTEHGLRPLRELIDLAPPAGASALRRDLELPASSPKQHVSVHVSPLEGRHGEDLGRLIMVEDLSDLLRAQKAAAWQEVARRIAHEIKNPLTPIQLAAQRLRKKLLARAPDLDQVVLEATASIENEVRGLKDLVDEFSRFARMPEIRPEPVEFDQVVESVLRLYRDLPGIRWEVELDPRVGWVRVDAQQMRRALINLVDNAIAAVDGQGTVRIGTRALGGKGVVRIEVADSGPGIPPEDRDKMFVPYFSTKKRGTGLGLAIVHKVVSDHQGTIRVEDNAPRGARFVIDIPA